MRDLRYVLYEKDTNLGIITLNRPEARNATFGLFSDEIDEAFGWAETDDEVKVIIIKANGPHFSAGADLGSAEAKAYQQAHPAKPAGSGGHWSIGAQKGLDRCRRWRDCPKPTIAAVQGAVVAGGLMLVWPCDLIVAAEDARFSDPVVRMGIGGIVYFDHPWQLGFRKAKELLFTGQFIDAQEAYRLGMVNRVVPRERLVEETLALARKIAEMPALALGMAKAAINQTQDMMGWRSAMDSYFGRHQLVELYNRTVAGDTHGGMDVQKMKERG